MLREVTSHQLAQHMRWQTRINQEKEREYKILYGVIARVYQTITVVCVMKLLSPARDKYGLIPNIWKRIIIGLLLLWVYIQREGLRGWLMYPHMRKQ